MTTASAASSRPADLSDAELDRLRHLVLRSHDIITAAQQPSGAYPACLTFSAYAGYAWFRDGAFVAEGISRYGDVASADAFHGWCATVLTSRREQIANLVTRLGSADPPSNAELLPTRFTYAGEAGQDPWWDFQTDGYGMWLWAVHEHANRHGLPLTGWQTAINLAVDYLCAVWDRPCYDWWEEHVEHRHVATLAAIAGGLKSALSAGAIEPARADRAQVALAGIERRVADEGIADGHLTKWLGTDAVDGSLASCVIPFGLVDRDSAVARATLAAVQADLDVDGGVHRFRADVFYGGGQWLLLSALLGWNLAAVGDAEGAWRHLRWIAAHAGMDDAMPEQVPDHLLHPETRPEWIERWGPVASPLLWSHGMYLILADELGLLPHYREEPS